jgi:hypothetical protein
MATLYDWNSDPVHDFCCNVTRCRNWFDMEIDRATRREEWTIKAATISDAVRVARYHFFLSSEIMVTG